jgi:hypothetical protein
MSLTRDQATRIKINFFGYFLFIEKKVERIVVSNSV